MVNTFEEVHELHVAVWVKVYPNRVYNARQCDNATMANKFTDDYEVECVELDNMEVRMVRKFGELKVGDKFRMTGAWLPDHEHWVFEKIERVDVGPNSYYNSDKIDDDTNIRAFRYEDDFLVDHIEIGG
jgi:hypothetical protein